MTSENLHVAGLRTTRLDLEAARERLWDDARMGRARVYVLVNAYSATLRRHHDAYASLLEQDAVVPLSDGAAITLGARLVGAGSAPRCPGPDLLATAARVAATDGTSFFLLGGDTGVAGQLAEELQRRHPGLRIAGAATPPFGRWSEAESRKLVGLVVKSDADILWLGVSAPYQEIWSVAWRGSIGRPIVCVGAAFDFLSGRKPRAPRWIRQIGLEWLFRLASEPGRLWRRYLVGNSVFIVDLILYGRRSPKGLHDPEP